MYLWYAHAAFTFNIPTLQVLNISGNNVPLFGRRHFARLGLTNLQRVAASRCGLVQIDSLAFVSLTNLVELDLSLNDLSEVNTIDLGLFMNKMHI